VHEKPRRSVICGGVENGDGMNNAGTVEACKSDPLQIMEKPAFEERWLGKSAQLG